MTKKQIIIAVLCWGLVIALVILGIVKPLQSRNNLFFNAAMLFSLFIGVGTYASSKKVK